MEKVYCNYNTKNHLSRNMRGMICNKFWKGVSAMCKAVEELVKQELLDIAKDMLEDGILSLEKIAEYSKLTLEEVKELAQQN